MIGPIAMKSRGPYRPARPPKKPDSRSMQRVDGMKTKPAAIAENPATCCR